MLSIISKTCECSSRRYQMLINFVLFSHINTLTPYSDPLGSYKSLAIAKHSFTNFNNICVTCVETYIKYVSCSKLLSCYDEP